MTDYLIMLLSTDWFLSLWPEIGIVVTDSMENGIQEGCRTIVRSFMDGKEEYYDIDFSDKRRDETDSMFVELLERTGTKEAVSATLSDWTGRPRDVLSTERMLRMLTRELQLNDSWDSGPHLDTSIRSEVVKARVNNLLDPGCFEKMSLESPSAWDVYIRRIFGDQPTSLSDNLAPFIRERRLRALWHRLSERLSLEQMQLLIAWSRAKAKLYGTSTDPIPYYINATGLIGR